MSAPRKFDQEMKDRAVRMCRDRLEQHQESKLAARRQVGALGTTRNAVVDAWDFLTRNPQESSSRNHRLRAEHSTVTRDGRAHDRWQHELPGARIWFYVDGQVVYAVTSTPGTRTRRSRSPMRRDRGAFRHTP